MVLSLDALNELHKGKKTDILLFGALLGIILGDFGIISVGAADKIYDLCVGGGLIALRSALRRGITEVKEEVHGD